MEYIKDKSMYAAFMYARKLLTYGKNLTNALGIASRTYKVDYKTLNHYMSSYANSKKKSNKGVKYKYYVVGCFQHQDDHDSGHNYLKKLAVKRALSIDNINKKTETTYRGNVAYHEYGEHFNYYKNYKELEFGTKKEAEDFLKNNTKKLEQYFEQYVY